MSVVINGSAGVTVNSGAVLGITSGTAVASTSGTSIDFTSIPSWVKRITVMFNGVSTNGTSNPQIQIGDSGGIETTGYAGTGATMSAGGITTTAFSSGCTIGGTHSAATVLNGSLTLSLLDSSSNTWLVNGGYGRSDAQAATTSSGAKALSATLDRVRITTVNGTDTFDAGSINILYE